MDKFCGSAFWDSNISWNTTDPYFTPCFELTLVTWVPAIFIMLFSIPVFVKFFKKRPINRIRTPWQHQIILKILLIVLLILTSMSQLGLLAPHIFSTPKSEIFAPIIRIFSYLFSFLLLIIMKENGIRNSGILSLFWLMTTLSEAILFRTAIQKLTNGEKKEIYIFRIITFSLCLAQFILNMWPDSYSINKKNENRKEDSNSSPEKKSSYFGKLFYTWYDLIAVKGYRSSIAQADLWLLNESDTSKSQSAVFFKYWNLSRKNGGVIWVLFKSYWPTFVTGGFLKLGSDLLVLSSPHILRLLINFVTDKTEQDWKGYLYASVLFASALVQALMNAQHNKRMLLIGMRIRTALSNAVYQKTLVLPYREDSSAGEIVNLMSVDIQRCMDLMPFIHMIWTAPIQIFLCLFFLYNFLGSSVLAGLGVLLLLIPVNGLAAAQVRKYQILQMKFKDQRVKLISEVLSGIKLVKLYAWESRFEKKIKEVRKEEIKLLRKTVFMHTVTLFAFNCAPVMASIATYALFMGIDKNNMLNTERIFVSLTLFNIMRMPLTMFPTAVSMLVQAKVSLNRINSYLNLEEIQSEVIENDSCDGDSIVIENGSFCWTDETGFRLRNINLRVKPGSLVAIVGTIGSGKSSLLNALFGNLRKLRGRVKIQGKIAYVSQCAWIQNGSIRENILFTDPFDEALYNNVVTCCSLTPDFELLPGGDLADIGEKGINLSGGQKQRISLARAAYKSADVYLFDDPLSAVDVHVGKYIFDNLIGPSGILKEKTRVIATHGISFLPKADVIVVMKDGICTEIGTYAQLIQNGKEFAKFIQENSSSIAPPSDRGGNQDKNQNSERIVESGIKSKTPKLVELEEPKTGLTDWKIYLDYIRACGVKNFFIALTFNIIFQMTYSYSSIWLSKWPDQTQQLGDNALPLSAYLAVYGGLGACQAICVIIYGNVLGLACLRASVNLHTNMLYRIMRAPMMYFERTLIGRLLNLFIKDVETSDNLLPLNLRATLNLFLSVIFTMAVISYATPVFILFIIPVAFVFFFIQRVYIATSRQLKRLESISRSPMYSHLSETISGVGTIRAFNVKRQFIETCHLKIDENQRTYFPYIASNSWIYVRLEVIGAVIILGATVFAILARDDISPGVIGLSVSYALQITQILSLVVRIMSDLETNIVSIERLKEVDEIPQEADLGSGAIKPPIDWPETGRIEFISYSTRYRDGLDLVLKNINCSINPGEKIGIVGRTGAGKSTLLQALLRIIEPVEGSILIDGLDVTKIDLHELRSKIIIIPQDPVLFSGTMRDNLDPFNLYTDDQIWKCLDLVHLKTSFRNSSEWLFSSVDPEGQNYSVGQRQLVCLARALLRKTKILVLDEATAAVDVETDHLIQKTIRNEFVNSTVITIAHRINAIMDSDRIFVFDKGEIKESDTPTALLANTESIFYRLASDSGLV